MVSLTMLSPMASSRSSPPWVRMRRVPCRQVQSGSGEVKRPAGISRWIEAICSSDRSGVANRKYSSSTSSRAPGRSGGEPGRQRTFRREGHRRIRSHAGGGGHVLLVSHGRSSFLRSSARAASFQRVRLLEHLCVMSINLRSSVRRGTGWSGIRAREGESLITSLCSAPLWPAQPGSRQFAAGAPSRHRAAANRRTFLVTRTWSWPISPTTSRAGPRPPRTRPKADGQVLDLGPAGVPWSTDRANPSESKVT